MAFSIRIPREDTVTDESTSDFTLLCKDKSYKTHKAIVCANSEIFRKAAEGPFKESTTNKIDLSDNDADLVEFAIRFMYEGSYKQYMVNFDDDYTVMFHGRMAQFADKYMMPKLFEYALEQFRTLVFADRKVYSMQRLLACAPEIFEMLPGSKTALKDTVVDQVAKEYAILTKHTWGKRDLVKGKNKGMNDLRRRIIELALDTLQQASKSCPDLAVGVQKKLSLAAAGLTSHGVQAKWAFCRLDGVRYLNCETCGVGETFEDPADEPCCTESLAFMCQSCLLPIAARDWERALPKIAGKEEAKIEELLTAIKDFGGPAMPRFKPAAPCYTPTSPPFEPYSIFTPSPFSSTAPRYTPQSPQYRPTPPP